MKGSEVTLVGLHPFEGVNLYYEFTGKVDGDTMQGKMQLGNSSPSTPGPLNQREYGYGRWEARRRSAEDGVGK